MSALNFTTQLNSEKFLEPIILKLKQQIREEMERYATQIITEEVAKFAIDLAKIVSIQDFRDQLVITIKKEIL